MRSVSIGIGEMFDSEAGVVYTEGCDTHPQMSLIVRRFPTMAEVLIAIKIEPLEEGGYLATSDELQGLVAQGRTVAETVEIA